MRRAIGFGVFLGLMVLAGLGLAALAAHPTLGTWATQPTLGTTGAPGFWLGLLHGLISPISLGVGLIDPTIRAYAYPNSGWWYDLGFVLGISVWGGASPFKALKAKLISEKSHPQKSLSSTEMKSAEPPASTDGTPAHTDEDGQMKRTVGVKSKFGIAAQWFVAWIFFWLILPYYMEGRNDVISQIFGGPVTLQGPVTLPNILIGAVICMIGCLVEFWWSRPVHFWPTKDRWFFSRKK